MAVFGGKSRLLWVFFPLCVFSILFTEQTLGDKDDGAESYMDLNKTLTDDHGVTRIKRFMESADEKHWKGGIVPFTYGDVTEINKRDIIGAMAFIEGFTSIRFVDWVSQKTEAKYGFAGHLVYRTTGGRGWSIVGYYKAGGGQSLDCPRLRTCVHELGHALGFQHEQSHYARDKWIRVNDANVRFEMDSWELLRQKGHYKTEFDYSSFMLYGPSAYKFYDVLYSEYPVEQRQFYMFKEMCKGYKCAESPQCQGHTLQCANEGYVSVVANKCSCVCLPGLDPETQCTTIKGKGPSKWPSGTFSLLAHKDGCPDGNFQTGHWHHYGEYDNMRPKLSIKGGLSGHVTDLHFCTQTTDSGSGEPWPPGNYCFLKKGECPNQRGVFTGRLQISGSLSAEKKYNSYVGAGPDGNDKSKDESRLDPSMDFCCMYNGFDYMPTRFPNTKPFVLFAYQYRQCQQVEGMRVKTEILSLHELRVFGQLDYKWNGRMVEIKMCVYTPLNRDCGGIIEVHRNRPVTIESDRNNPSLRQCDWIFKSAEDKGTLVWTFDEFDVKSTTANCGDNYMELQTTQVAQKGAIYCNDLKLRSYQSTHGKIRAQLNTGENSRSYFRATIKMIPASDMCYSVEDNGVSYRGTVSYTRAFEPCIPWAETTSCPHHPYQPFDIEDGLVSNYCRNPDGGVRPWCYTNIKGCKRNACDVCQLGEPFDTAKDCDERRRRGECHQGSVDCAKTCRINDPSSIPKAIQCGRPEHVPGGELVGPKLTNYKVGGKVTFRCDKGKNILEKTCLSTGQWSFPGASCMACPLGYIQFNENCYKYFFDGLTFVKAERNCYDLGGVLALPKSREENDFMASLKQPYNRMWIGAARRRGFWETTDGKHVTWTNWKFYDVPHPYNCAYMREDTYWKDFNLCSNQYNKYHYICEIPVSDVPHTCNDAIDSCPSLVNAIHDSNCDTKPGFSSYCRYSCDECSEDCHQTIRLSENDRRRTIIGDRSKVSSRLCIWDIEPPKKEGRLVLKFEEFDVKSTALDCVDSVEVRRHKHGQPYTRMCNRDYNTSVVIDRDHMLVKFKSPRDSSSSRFKAVVEWIPDSDMCYNVADKGWSYSGPLRYTRTFQPCLSWADALQCENQTLWNSYFLDNLNGDYCRNPDGSDRPWCYNSDCQKEYCDVCHLGNPSDTSTNCQAFKNAGKCKSEFEKAVTECAETCQNELQGPKVKVSDVSCPTPSQVPKGSLKNPKRQYKVGEEAEYECTNSKSHSIKRTCLSTGTWSVANTACMDCPYGFIGYREQCYKYFPIYTDKDGAINHCAKFGAVVATPKDEIENTFVASLRNNERIWLGAKKGRKTFEWNDKTQVYWPNWTKDKKKFKYRDNCMVLEKDATRTDDWCRNKLFHFVCQLDKVTDQSLCADYLNICPVLTMPLPMLDCTPYPSLMQYCRSSCGQCITGCQKKIHLTSINQEYQIDTVNSNDKICSWKIKGDTKQGRFIVTVDEIDMRNPDSLELTTPDSDVLYKRFTNNNHERTTYVSYDRLDITVKGQESTKSSFKITVKWVADPDMCYDMKDKGWSYAGQVGYTKTFKSCLPWSRMLHCPHNPHAVGDFLDRLEHNYCRNPDQSDAPWCYTSMKCEREYCDVCQLETPVDTASDCANRKRRGLCTKDSIDCALTCQIASKFNIKKVSNVECGVPSKPSGADILRSYRKHYDVGEKVVFKCLSGPSNVERVCLSTGQWSTANTACLDCPLDQVHFGDHCYKFVNKQLDFKSAVAECEKQGLQMAMGKTKESNLFLAEYSRAMVGQSSNYLTWVGIKKKGNKYYWNDNTPVTSTHWSYRKNMNDRDNCALMHDLGYWYDDWCHDKYSTFVCQSKKPKNSQPECVDFLDNCPEILSFSSLETCKDNSRMESVCRKTCGLCPRDCGGLITLNVANSRYEIAADRRKEANRYCEWEFIGHIEGRYVIQFHEMGISTSHEDCVEIRTTKDGKPIKYCRNHYDPDTEITSQHMFIRFRTTADSKSYFKATVSWKEEQRMCYNTSAKGRYYNGKVDYTSAFLPCMSWAEAANCHDHNLFKASNFIVTLEGSYCRNPDDSDRPWCFTRGCTKNYCDVCHIGKPFDTINDCRDFKSRGECTSRPDKALKWCAATCDVIDSKSPPISISYTQCLQPEPMPGATLEEIKQGRFEVGQTVSYKCSRGHSIVYSSCLTSGEWSRVDTACLDCPHGWTPFDKKCYRHVNQYITYVEAENVCQTMSAIIAPTKTKAVNDFITKTFVKPIGDSIWLGAKRDQITKQFVWSDGETMSWSNWRDQTAGDNCALSLSDGFWKFDWCHDKYYSFVCQLDGDDNPECVDFMPACSELTSKTQCNSVLKSYCRRSCGACN